jgi:hypothetical protein
MMNLNITMELPQTIQAHRSCRGVFKNLPLQKRALCARLFKPDRKGPLPKESGSIRTHDLHARAFPLPVDKFWHITQ